MPAQSRRKDAARNRDARKDRMTRSRRSARGVLSFTIDASTGRVLKVETLDAKGARREVSEKEKATLARARTERIEDALEQAFEAGIECVLGGEVEAPEVNDSDNDVALRHVLVSPLMQQSPASRLLQREVLDRAILETLLQHSLTSGSTPGGRHAAGAGSESPASPPTL